MRLNGKAKWLLTIEQWRLKKFLTFRFRMGIWKKQCEPFQGLMNRGGLERLGMSPWLLSKKEKWIGRWELYRPLRRSVPKLIFYRILRMPRLPKEIPKGF